MGAFNQQKALVIMNLRMEFFKALITIISAAGPLVQQHCEHYEHGSSMCPDRTEETELSQQSPQYGGQDTAAAPSLQLAAGLLAVLATLSLAAQ